MRQVIVKLTPPYWARIEAGCLAQAGELLREFLPPRGRVIVVTVSAIRKAWGSALESGLASGGVRAETIEMPDGEGHKNLSTIEGLAEAMSRVGADRDAVVIALGGGVVGDVAGFLASVFMRGVPVVQVPTTLVAMVDSSLGGKTGVNLKTGKNLVGAFHQPRAILVDPTVLRTLPEREFRSGFAEAIKCGVIRNPELFAYIESHIGDLLRLDTQALEWMIAECLQIKADVVAADEREGDLRRILNFGHTLGHALESATSYHKYLHGEAVAWGMIAASQLAVKLGMLESQIYERIRRLVMTACGPLPPLNMEADILWQYASRDKKRRGGRLHWVLPRAVGQVEITTDVSAQSVSEAIAEIRS